MRILPRINRPSLKRLRRRWRRWGHISVANGALVLELLLFVALWLFIFTGRRGAFIDGWGRRADLAVMLGMQALSTSMVIEPGGLEIWARAGGRHPSALPERLR